MKQILACMTVATVLFGCPESEHEGEEHEGEEHEGEEHEGEEHEGEEHEGEIRLSQEAITRGGVKIGRVERRGLTGGVAIPAEVQFEPSSTAHVGPLAPGRFTKVNVGLGQNVTRGQLLGAVASTDVATARAQLGQAQARLVAADSALNRQRQLSTQGIGAARSLVEAESEASQLRAEVEGLRRQLSVFGSSASGELRLVSPIDGVVVAMHATLGETASTEEVAFVVTDPTRIWVIGHVPELEISRVQPSSAAIVRLHAYPDLALEGTVTYVAPALDERTRSLPIRVTLSAPDARLRSGLFGVIELLGGPRDERVVVVPASAIATVEGQSVVFVPADEPGSFEPAAIELGRHAGGYYEVRSGLEEGAAIVTEGAFVLKSVLQSGELSEGHAH